MKNICMIVQNYYDIDPRVKRKAQALIDAGFNVDVISLRMNGEKKIKYKLDGVNVYSLPIIKQRGSILRYAYEYLQFFLLAMYKVSLMMFKKKYYVVEINTLPDFLVFAGILPKLMGAKIVLDLHEVMPEFYQSKYKIEKNNIIYRLILLQERLSFNFADYVITINDPIQKLLEKRGLCSKKTIILMNSADENVFKHYKSKEKRIKKKNDKFIMMYHGTLTSIYGLDIALKAFNAIEDKMLDAQFWIIGEGPDKKKLEKLVKQFGMEKKVKFFGMISHKNIHKILALCDVGILPTKKDPFLELSFSNKLSEYIIMKKPVIVSRLKTIKYYFSEKAIVFYEPENQLDLSKKMLFLYNNESLRKAIVERAKTEYSKISWNVMKKRYINFIEKIILKSN